MKKLISLFTLSYLITLSVTAQTKPAEKYAATITEATLKKHLNIIASDSMEGRETGMPGQKMAAAYIEQQFIKAGLKPATSLKSYQQEFPIGFDSVIKAEISINNEKLINGKDVLIPLMDNVSGSFEAGKIVFVGYGIDDPMYSDYENVDVKGKLVCFFAGEPKRNQKYFINKDETPSAWETDFSLKFKTAADKGAAGIMLLMATNNGFSKRTLSRNLKSGMYFDAENPEKLPLHHFFASNDLASKLFGDDMSLITEAAKNKKMLQDMKKEVPFAVSFQFEKYSGGLESSNVVGVIEGSDKKDEYVFLTAHYDHLGKKDGVVYNGADDDGSGTVAVIQMAAAFAQAKKEGHGPRRTVVCMTVSGEEKGLWGSEYYSEHPLFPLEKTSVDLNTDMIGRVDTERTTPDSLNYVYVVGHDKLSSDLIINEQVNETYTKLKLDYKFDDPNDTERIYYRSDHYNFARKGVPVLFFYDGMLKADYHQPTDDIDKINWPLMTKRARLIFHTAWEMANRNEMLKRDKPLPTGRR